MLLSGVNMTQNVTLANIDGSCYNFIKIHDHLTLEFLFQVSS